MHGECIPYLESLGLEMFGGFSDFCDSYMYAMSYLRDEIQKFLGCVCVCVHVPCNSIGQTKSVDSFLSFHLYVGSRD